MKEMDEEVKGVNLNNWRSKAISKKDEEDLFHKLFLGSQF